MKLPKYSFSSRTEMNVSLPIRRSAPPAASAAQPPPEPSKIPDDFNNAKAKLTIGSTDDHNLTVVAQYNPRELQTQKAHNWSSPKNIDKQIDSTQQEYTGQTPASLSIELLFDAVETKGIIDGRSVMGLIADLEILAAPRDPSSRKEDVKRPHHCIVVFGSGIEAFPPFGCVIESVDTKYQMFSNTGNVTRATVTLKLKQCDRSRERKGLAREWFR